jgi:O-antigen ligase
MRSEILAILPGIMSWWITATQSAKAAFFNVYLPVLLLIPDNFRLPIDGLPDPTFSQSAILPIGFAVGWRAIFKREWTFTFLDFCILAFVAWQFISDFHNVGYGDAQNLLFDMVTLAVLPYMCGKALIEPAGLRAQFARRFVWLLFVVSMISIYEFRMGAGLFRPAFMRFFPGQDAGWFTQLRWGFGRIAGPYGHAILMGSILSIAYLLCRWLSQSGQWETHFKWLGEIPFTKPQILTVGLVVGMLMTLSRGPWLGAVCGLVIASIGVSAKPNFALKRAILILAAGGVLFFYGGKAYLSNSPPPDHLTTGSEKHLTSEVEQSTAYRAELFDKYVDIAMRRPIWGWGRANWPQVPGMSSIDNNYLFIALNTGLVGLALFVGMILIAAARLFHSGFSAMQVDATERSFRFTLLGIVAAITVSTASVFLGSQLYPLLFLILGWTDACVISRSAQASAQFAENEAIDFNPGAHPAGGDFVRVVA